jgi:hypothetical protein
MAVQYLNAKLWSGWQDETREAYRNGGAKLGEYLTQFPEKEPEIWNLVKDAGLWPRKYLNAFRQHYRLENPEKAKKLLKKGAEARRLRRKKSREMDARQEELAQAAEERILR